MTWILFIIMISPNGEGYKTKVNSFHEEMDKCFERRQEVVELLGKPIVNYQAICVRSDKVKVPGQPV